jgi:hypothetical protein
MTSLVERDDITHSTSISIGPPIHLNHPQEPMFFVAWKLVAAVVLLGLTSSALSQGMS